MSCTVAIDAMGGDRAPAEIVAGALAAVERLGVASCSSGAPRTSSPTSLTATRPTASRSSTPREVIAMNDEPAAAVRTQKDSSIVRCAAGGARRPGRRDGRRRQHGRDDGCGAAAHRAHPGRRPTRDRRADPGAVRPPAAPGRRGRDGRRRARVARPVRAHGPRVRPYAASASTNPPSVCSRTARRRARATSCARTSFELMQKVPGFVGNVEGRDFMHAGTST